MRILFAVFGLALIITGAVLVLVPREERAQTRSFNPQQVVSMATRVRDIADQVNGPLSIVFGLISLYYSRKRYIVARDNPGADKTG
jgi:hypothetical protein